jgi:nucleoid-associated protein YgaU
MGIMKPPMPRKQDRRHHSDQASDSLPNGPYADDNFDSEPYETAPPRAPGVYTRKHPQGEANADLDVLWSLSRVLHKEERQSLLFLLSGFFSGVLLTSLVFVLFLNRPALPPIEDLQPDLQTRQGISSAVTSATQPLVTAQAKAQSWWDTAIVLPLQNLFKAQPKTGLTGTTGTLPGDGTGSPSSVTAGTAEEVPTGTAGKSYEVKAGDNLGSIAEQFYGSSDIKLVEKLQRTNDLKNVNALREGQVLVIPPKAYN